MTARDWTPRLIGDTYCSPACGMGCKKSAYDEAQRKALDLHNKMTGKAWSIRVWENLGWHYELVRESKSSAFRCSIMEVDNRDGTMRYIVYFNSNPQVITKGDDPNVALDEAVRQAKRIANTLLDNVALFPETRT
jgi:hypothetical protein